MPSSATTDALLGTVPHLALGLVLTSVDRCDLGVVGTGTAKDVTCTHDSYSHTDRCE